MAITEEMIIAEVLKKYPSSKKVFEKYIPQCPKCGGAVAESIGRGARLHGVDPEMLVAELNRAAKTRKKK
jgi:hybrid cluster-associated redox disulfide protein